MYWIAGHLTLSALVLTGLFGCKGKSASIKPEYTDIVESVYASATVKAENQYLAYATVSGILKSAMVREGDTIKAGQVIARIDNTSPGLSQANAKVAYELASGNFGTLDELKAQLASARRQFVNDSVNYQRQKILWNQGIGTQNQLESRQLALDVSANAWHALQVRYRQSKLQLELAQQQAQNNLSLSAENNRNFDIVSLMNGRVYQINYDPGELVLPQQAVALIGSASKFLLEMEVDEVDIARIHTGQQVIVTMDAYQGQVFQARVSRIIPAMDPKTQTFKVEAEFVNPPANLYPGFTAEANIVIEQKKHVLVIPIEYLKNGDSVHTEAGDKKVKTGLRGIDKIEILEGLDANSYLLKP